MLITKLRKITVTSTSTSLHDTITFGNALHSLHHYQCILILLSYGHCPYCLSQHSLHFYLLKSKLLNLLLHNILLHPLQGLFLSIFFLKLDFIISTSNQRNLRNLMQIIEDFSKIFRQLQNLKRLMWGQFF